MSKRRVEFTYETLAKQARYLADDMNRLAAKLDQQKAAAHVNSLGGVQRQGSEIDRLCNEFMMLKRYREELQAAIEREAAQAAPSAKAK